MADALIALTTTGNADDAKKLAHTIVEEHLAACVNIVPIQSVYTWEGAIQDEAECLLVMKTSSLKIHQLEARLHRIHPYSVPEFVAVSADHVADAYKDWLMNWVS